VIHVLTHLRFEADEAALHWERVLAHRAEMQARLAMAVDLRVALVSYFLDVNRQLQNPKVIEMQLFQRTQLSAYLDGLTSLRNYRSFREHLDREVDRSDRYNEPLSLLMLDIDYFKSYNDRNGHLAGNDALATVARLIADCLRKVDLPARYGGEEFVVILPATPKMGAHLVAERIRRRIEGQLFPDRDHPGRERLTASLGVATFPGDAMEPRDLVSCADRALYAAKSRGRNQVQLYNACRRSHRRLSASIDGKYCCVSSEYRPLTTVNVSEAGVLVCVEQSLLVGTLVELRLELEDPYRIVGASARVVRVAQRDDGLCEAALRLVDITREDLLALKRHLREIDAPEEPPDGLTVIQLSGA
jgi:diguanylate cyclase (GGDEF)-like protein